jgi:signal transduction histidine kinase
MRRMSMATVAPGTTLFDRSTLPLERAYSRLIVLGSWHSQVALGVYAVALTLMDALHTALRMPPVRPVAIWWHLVIGLVVYPLLITFALQMTRRFRLDSALWMRNAVVHLLFGLVLQYAHYLLLRWTFANIVWPVVYPGEPFTLRLVLGIGERHFREYPIDLLAYWLVIAFEHASRYYSALGEQDLAAAKLETRLAEARLDALRRQLSPHFLFNTLNTISVLAMRGDKDSVVETLARLSDLLRVALDEDRRQFVTLRDEMAFLEGYLGIQQVRFGDRLKVVLNVDPDTVDALVPSMLLQPILENAMEHGVSAQTGGATITVIADIDEDQLRIQVRDSGPGFSTSVRRVSTRKRGIGLANTKQRLHQLYQNDCSIRCFDPPGGGASVELRLPFRPNSLAAEGDHA